MYESKFIDFNGWEMPISFEGTLKEHMKVRNNAGFFDVSHMGMFKISIDDISILNFMICGDIDKNVKNTALYTMILNKNGGIIDDVIIWKFESYLILICNSLNIHAIKQCLSLSKLKYIYLNQIASLIAVQGPHVIDKLKDYFDIPNHFECNVQYIDIFTNEVLIARTGYTGEDGIEVLIHHDDDIQFINLLEELDVNPCGLGARDTLRLEATLPLYGHELDESISPLDVGFRWIVDFDNDFNGKKSLIKQMESGMHKYLAKFIINDRIVSRRGDIAMCKNIQGIVTSGNYSPILKKCIGFILFKSKPKSDIIILNVRDKFVDGKLIKGKFLG